MLDSRDINRLRPDVAANCRIFLNLCRAEGLNVLITGTVRDAAYQEYCYAKGWSLTKVPSFHAEHAGLAFDICKNVKKQYIPPLNRIMRTAIRWRGAGHPIELFVDGVRVGQVGPTNSYPAKAAAKYLGCNSGTTRTLAGEFFEHMVYTKPLEDAEILHNYNVSVRRYGEGG